VLVAGLDEGRPLSDSEDFAMNSRLLLLVAAILGCMLIVAVPMLASADKDIPSAGGCSTPSPAAVEQTQTGSRKSQLGIHVTSMPPALSAHLSEVAGKGRGVLIADVADNSPAAKAGLKTYDVLVQYEQQDLYSPDQLTKLVANETPGRNVTLGFVHEGKYQTATVQVTTGAPREPKQSHTTFRLPFDDLIPFKDFEQRLFSATTPSVEEKDLWADFEALSIRKTGPSQFEVSLDYRGSDDKAVHRSFSGSLEQIRETIESDRELPEAARQRLLRTLSRSLSSNESPSQIFQRFLSEDALLDSPWRANF